MLACQNAIDCVKYILITTYVCLFVSNQSKSVCLVYDFIILYKCVRDSTSYKVEKCCCLLCYGHRCHCLSANRMVSVVGDRSF